MTATNLFSVSSFGEFEFWFAGIKVAAIIAFLAIGLAYVFGLWPGKSMDFSNLYCARRIPAHRVRWESPPPS